MNQLLTSIQNLYFSGNYESAIKELSKHSYPEPEFQKEKNKILIQSYINTKNLAGLKETFGTVSKEPYAELVKLIIANFNTFDHQKYLDFISTKLDHVKDTHAKHFCLVLVGTIFLKHGLTEEAFKVLAKHETDLECMALIVYIYLSLNRTDLAKKEVDKMKTINEDSIITQLAEAWLFLCLKNGKSALYIYQDFAEISEPSALLLNSQAVGNYLNGKKNEASRFLQEALSHNSADATVLANQLIINWLTKSDSTSHDQDKIKKIVDANPLHPFSVQYQARSDLFDKASEKAY